MAKWVTVWDKGYMERNEFHSPITTRYTTMTLSNQLDTLTLAQSLFDAPIQEHLQSYEEIFVATEFFQILYYNVTGMVGERQVTVVSYLDLETGAFSYPRLRWVACLDDLPIQTVENFRKALNQALNRVENWFN